MKHIIATAIGIMLVGALAPSVSAQGREGARGRQGGAAPQAPAATTLAGDVMADLENTRELIINMVDAMPEDKFSFKPTPAQRSFAESAMHIVQVDQFLFRTLGAKTAAPAINMKATTKAEILAALRQSYEWQATLLKEFNDQQLVERVTPPGFLGTSASRLRIIYYDLAHTQDTYGQLVVYLRLNGVTPPASRRGGV